MQLKVPSGRRRFFGVIVDFYFLYPAIVLSLGAGFGAVAPVYSGLGYLIGIGICAALLLKGKSPSKYVLGMVVVDVSTGEAPAAWKLLTREVLRGLCCLMWLALSVPVLILYTLWISRHRIMDPSSTPLSDRPIANFIIQQNEKADRQAAGRHMAGVFGWLASKPRLLFWHDTVMGTTVGQIVVAASAVQQPVRQQSVPMNAKKSA